MNNALFSTLSCRLHVIVGAGAASLVMSELIAEQALEGPLQVIDCGSVYSADQVGGHLRARTTEVRECLKRVHLARAFTCGEVADKLDAVDPGNRPVVVLDLLQPFYGELVGPDECRHELSRCLARLKQLGELAPVVVSARAPAEGFAARMFWLLELEGDADVLHYLGDDDQGQG